MLKALKGLPTHLEIAENYPLGKHDLDILCLNLPPICNYNCKKCFNAENRKNLHKSLSLQEYLNLITEARKLGAVEIAILGEGEPLLYKDIKTVVKHANDNGMYTLIATNGSLLRPEMAVFLAEHNASLAVSLDTLDPKEYNSYYRASLDVVLNNLDVARKIYKTSNYEKNGVKVYGLAVHMTVNTQNYRKIEQIVDYCKDDMYFSCEHIALVGAANENPEISGVKNMVAYLDCQRKAHTIMQPMVLTKTPDNKPCCCYFYYGLAIGFDGEVMVDTHAGETKGIVGNIKNFASMKDALSSVRQIRDEYFQSPECHYCLIRNNAYQEFLNKYKQGR